MSILNRRQLALCLSSLFLMGFCIISNAASDYAPWYNRNGAYSLCEGGIYNTSNTQYPTVVAYSSCSKYLQAETLTVTVHNKLSYPIQFNCQALASSVNSSGYDSKNTGYASPPSCMDSSLAASLNGLIKAGATATLTLNSGALMPFINQFGLNPSTPQDTHFNNNSSQVLLSIGAGTSTWRFPFSFNEYALSNVDDCLVSGQMGGKACNQYEQYHMSVFQMLNYSLSASFLANTNWWETNCLADNADHSCIFFKAGTDIQKPLDMTRISEGKSNGPRVIWDASGLIHHGVSPTDPGFWGVVFYADHNSPSTYGTIALTVEKGASS